MYKSVIISRLSRVREVGRVESLEDLVFHPQHKDLRIKVVGGTSTMMQYLEGHPLFDELKPRLEPFTYPELRGVKKVLPGKP